MRKPGRVPASARRDTVHAPRPPEACEPFDLSADPVAWFRAPWPPAAVTPSREPWPPAPVTPSREPADRPVWLRIELIAALLRAVRATLFGWRTKCGTVSGCVKQCSPERPRAPPPARVRVRRGRAGRTRRRGLRGRLRPCRDRARVAGIARWGLSLRPGRAAGAVPAWGGGADRSRGCRCQAVASLRARANSLADAATPSAVIEHTRESGGREMAGWSKFLPLCQAALTRFGWLYSGN